MDRGGKMSGIKMLNIATEILSVAGMISKASDSKEYLVEGAKLFCVNGSKITLLQIPDGHSYTSGGRKKANCRDCKACANIESFGDCHKNDDTHQCEGFMDLDEKWENTSVSGAKAELVCGEEAITMSSVLLCKKGGIVIPVTSGQGYDDKVNWAAFLLRYQNVYKWAVGKNLACHIYGKDPINMNTGNYIYEKGGLFIDGAMPISFQLFYNAMSCRDSGNLGEGWNHNYDVWLEKISSPNLIAINLEDGKEVLYHRNIQGDYSAVMGDLGILKDNGDEYQFQTPEGILYYFNQDGQLKRQYNSNGNGRFFEYHENSDLKSVKNESGEGLDFTYNAEGQLIAVSDHTGRKIELGYEYGKLRWFIDVEEKQYTYDYNENGKLNEILTPEGKSAIKNEYDGADRVSKQIMPNGTVVELRYDDKNNRTYMKEENGNMIIFESDKRQRNIKTIYEDGEEHFTYNDRNQKTLYTDKKGFSTRYAYDNRGNLTKIIDALGQIFNMTYDDQNHMISMKFPDGTSIKNVYNETGKLVETIDRGGNSTKVEYESQGNIRKIIQPDHSAWRFQYNSNGNVTRVTDAAGTIEKYTYDDLRQITSIEDGNGNVTRFNYTPKGNLKEIINAEGNKRVYEYNHIGNVTKVTDFDHSTERREYDESGRCCKHIDAEGNCTVYAYNETGKLTQKTLANGGTYFYSYHHLGRLQTVTDPLGNVTEFYYDVNGNCVKELTSNGAETLFAYDALNRLVSVTEADGLITQYGYNEDNHVSKISDNHGNQATVEYNYMGYPEKVTDVYGNCTVYSYDCLGQVVHERDGAGRETAYSYYPGNLLKKIDYYDGLSQSFSYDVNKNMIKTVNQDNFMVFYSYDCLNRINKITDSMGREKRYTFDNGTNITSLTDANGNTTRYEYSGNGNLKKVTEALGNVTIYEYDSIGNLITSTRKGISQDESVRYQRNLMGKIEAITNALGDTEYYNYDSDGHMTRKLDRDGYETCFGYTLMGQLNHIKYADGNQVTLQYDSLRRLIEVEDWSGRTKMEWGTYQHLKSVTDYKGRKVSYDFTPMGQLAAMVYPDGREVTYSYDTCLRLSGLSDERGRIQYDYKKGDLLLNKAFSNGLKLSYDYNEAGQLVKLCNYEDKRILDQYRYSYDPVGNKIEVEKNRTGIDADNGVFQYEYNPSNQLTKVMRNGAALREYQYDEFGNRIKKREGDRETTYSYNLNNQLMCETEEDVINYSYDLRGNMTDVLLNGVPDKSYEFDAMNHLKKAFHQSGAAGIYEYNGFGHRTGKQVFDRDMSEKKNEIEYVVDVTKRGRNLLQKIEKGNAEDYVWDQNIISAVSKDYRRQYVNDELGSPIRTYFSNGREDGKYSYDEFGNIIDKVQNKDQPIGFTGYQWDEISSTYYAQAREYCPTTGAFISEDSVHNIIGLPGTLNSYAYCWGNPGKWVDVNGLFSRDEITKWGMNQVANEYRRSFNAWKDDVSNTINEIGDQINSGLNAAGEAIGNGVNAFQNGVSDVITGVNEFWNNEIYGVDRDLYKEGGFSVKTHTGGNIIVVNVNEKNKFDSWTVDLSLKIPFTELTVGYSLSGESWSPFTWKTKNYTKITEGNMNSSVGWGVNKEGIYGNISMEGKSDTLPLVLPNGVEISSYTNIKWTYSKDTTMPWKTVKKYVIVAGCVIVIGATVFLAPVVAPGVVAYLTPYLAGIAGLAALCGG